MVVEESEEAIESHIDGRRLEHRRIVRGEPDAAGGEFERDVAIGEEHQAILGRGATPVRGGGAGLATISGCA